MRPNPWARVENRSTCKIDGIAGILEVGCGVGHARKSLYNGFYGRSEGDHEDAEEDGCGDRIVAQGTVLDADAACDQEGGNEGGRGADKVPLDGWVHIPEV